ESIAHEARFQSGGIDASQACCSAVGHEDVALIGNDSSGFWKAVQRREMAAGVRFNDLNAVAGRMRHKNAATLRLKGSVIERGFSRIRYLDDAFGLKQHGNLRK